MKKHLVIGVIALGLILGGIAINKKGETVEYLKGETVEVITEVKVNPLDEQIKQREKELEEKYSKIKSIEARIDVNVAEIERLDAQVLADRKELASFMTKTQ